MPVCSCRCVDLVFVLQEKCRHWKSPACSGSWHRWLHSPVRPFTTALQREGRLLWNKAEGRAITMIYLLYATGEKNEKPLPDSLGLPLRRIEPAERISCNTGQRLLCERVGEMNKRVQLEEELRISRYSFCLCPAARPVPLGVGAPSATWDLQQWCVTLRLHPRLQEMRSVACERHRRFLAGEEGNTPSGCGEAVERAQIHRPSQPTLPDLPCPTRSRFHARCPSLLQHTGSHRGWAFPSPSRSAALSESSSLPGKTNFTTRAGRWGPGTGRHEQRLFSNLS